MNSYPYNWLDEDDLDDGPEEGPVAEPYYDLEDLIHIGEEVYNAA